MLGYQITLTPDDNDTYLVTCPALPEVTTFGATHEEIQQAAIGAIEEALAARIAGGADLPEPALATRKPNLGQFVKIPAMTVLKVLLANALRESNVTRAELARRLDWHREQVDRLFRLDHASRLDQIEAAFNALDRDLDFNLLDAAE